MGNLLKLVLTLFVLIAAGCAEDAEREYFINGQWQKCSYLGENACGQTLRCGDELFECQVNVQSRSR